MSGLSSITYSSEARGMGYSLGGTHRATCRLNLQHYLWREAIGYSVHPRITLPTNAAIADVAVGSALWIADVAREYPSATLHGLDIDLSQAPHPHWLPSNTRLSTWDIFTDPPTEMQGIFDLVHLRLIVVVLAVGSISAVINRLKLLLKPGGWIQWDELDPGRISVKKISVTQQCIALDELARLMQSDGQYNWTAQLGSFLRQEGLQVVAEEAIGDPPHLARAYNDQHLLTMDEFATRLAEEGKHEAAEHFARTIRQAYDESVSGPVVCIPRIVYVAKVA